MLKKGLIVIPIDQEDWMFGADNAINRVKIGSVLDFLPTTESQRFNKFDPWWCVVGSLENNLEIKFNYKIKNNLFRADNVKWLKDNGYFDENGKINFDDWFLARVSNTIPGEGNSFKQVAQAARKYGLTPQSKSPFIITDKTNDSSDYYQDIPQELYDIGKEFSERFDLNYETVMSSQFISALEYGPLQVAVSNWRRVDGVYVSNGDIIHATTLFEGLPWQVFDTYSPFIKQLEDNYNFMCYGYQWYVNEVNNNSLIQKIMDFWVRFSNGAIFWGKAGTNKIQKVTKENAGLVAITHLMRKDGESVETLKDVNDDEFKKYEVTEEYFGSSNTNFLKKIFN